MSAIFYVSLAPFCKHISLQLLIYIFHLQACLWRQEKSTRRAYNWTDWLIQNSPNPPQLRLILYVVQLSLIVTLHSLSFLLIHVFNIHCQQ